MPMRQQTDEWFAARLGCLTASRFADAMARNRNSKDGWGVSRYRYRGELVSERLMGRPYPRGFESAELRRGRELEPQAREVYSVVHGVDVEEVGFIKHPSIPMSGGSPDGMVGDHGLIEIKCLLTHNHIEVRRTGQIDTGYLTQIQWLLACTGRAWCDYVGYDDNLPPRAGLYVQRVERDPMVIQLMEKEAVRFLAEVDELEDEYRALCQLPRAA